MNYWNLPSNQMEMEMGTVTTNITFSGGAEGDLYQAYYDLAYAVGRQISAESATIESWGQALEISRANKAEQRAHKLRIAEKRLGKIYSKALFDANLKLVQEGISAQYREIAVLLKRVPGQDVFQTANTEGNFNPQDLKEFQPLRYHAVRLDPTEVHTKVGLLIHTYADPDISDAEILNLVEQFGTQG